MNQLYAINQKQAEIMRTIITILIILIFSISFGQKTNQIKLHYGFVEGDYVPSEDLVGAGSSKPFKANEIGITYNKRLVKYLE